MAGLEHVTAVDCVGTATATQLHVLTAYGCSVVHASCVNLSSCCLPRRLDAHPETGPNAHNARHTTARLSIPREARLAAAAERPRSIGARSIHVTIVASSAALIHVCMESHKRCRATIPTQAMAFLSAQLYSVWHAARFMGSGANAKPSQCRPLSSSCRRRSDNASMRRRNHLLRIEKGFRSFLANIIRVMQSLNPGCPEPFQSRAASLNPSMHETG